MQSRSSTCRTIALTGPHAAVRTETSAACWDIYRVVRLGLGELLRRMRTHRDIDVVDLVHTLFAATLNGDQRGSSGRT